MHFNHEEPSQYARDIAVQRFSTLASLVVLLYEYSITVGDEVCYIWRAPFNAVRFIYAFSRYVAIIGQCVNLYLVLFGPLSTGFVEESHCKTWFAFQMASSCFLLAALDIILSLRVYALHKKSRRVGVFLVLLLVAQAAVEVAFGPRTVREVRYNGVCDTRETHPAVVYFFVAVLGTHISLGILTGVKSTRLATAGLHAPVVKMVARDGALALSIICGVFAFIIPHSLIGQVGRGHVIFGWLIIIESICCCRMIMNLQKFRLTGTSEDQESALSQITDIGLDLDIALGLDTVQ